MQRVISPRLFRPFIFLLFWYSTPLFAFQMADGAPPPKSPAEKYIFYWGSLQCDLTEANGYKGSISLTPPAFRRMLLAPPHLWDGKVLIKSFSFNLEGKRVNTGDYLTEIGALDTIFGQKVVPGQVLHISSLQLDAHTNARIELRILAPDLKDDKSTGRNWSPLPANFLSTRLVSRVIWGREDAYDISNRDFFTVAEFWQTVRLMPVVEWQPYTTPEAVTASIRFPDLSAAAFSLTARLDEQDYRQLLQNLENFRHLARQGTTVDLALYTADSYTELFQKPMILVADNDPRLALRRDRDLHALVIQWSNWPEKIDGLYLQRLTDGTGQVLEVDQPISRRYRFTKAELDTLLAGMPEFRIDGQRVPDISFRLSMPGDTIRIHSGEVLPDTLRQKLLAGYQKNTEVTLDSFQSSEYELPAIEMILFHFDPLDRLPVRNDFGALYNASSTVLVKLVPPTFSDHHYYFDFELPIRAPARFSIFEPDGWNVFVSEDQFSTGPHTMRVPRSAFRSTGKHYCFLNTPLGVAKLEFEVE